VTDPAHNDRWGDDLAAYALDALDATEREAVERHLADCADCTERLRWLMPAVDVLPATVPQAEPPPALRARLMEAVEAEAADPVAARPAARSWRERLGLTGLSLRPAVAGLAVLLVVAAGVTGYVLRDGDSGPQAESFAAQGVGSGKQAHGTLEVEGDRGTLTVADLPPTKPGEVYQAWVQDTDAHGGTIHPSSVFVVTDDGSGTVTIPHGLSRAQLVMVTREPEGGSEKPHSHSVMNAELS
jgi:anti-sigma factor RsiW